MVVITTYNRQREVEALVARLRTIYKGEIVVFDDGSEPIPNLSYICCEVIRYKDNHGKRGYYRLVTDIFKFLKTKDFKYFWMLPDDIIPSDDLFEHSTALWEAIADPRKICLSVGHTHGRHYHPCWTYFQPIKMGEVVLTQWNDLCFMAEKRFLELLNYEILEPLPGYDWRSSGVGRHISRTLHNMNWNMYHVDKSLCEFPANETRMQAK